jgi:hypothetical protein
MEQDSQFDLSCVKPFSEGLFRPGTVFCAPPQAINPGCVRIVARPLMRNLHYSGGICNKNPVFGLPRAFERILQPLFQIMAFLSLGILIGKLKNL